MKRFLPIIFVAIMLFQTLSCASFRSGKSNVYNDMLKKNTVNGKVYDNFETKLIAGATYKDIDFMEAQLNKKGDDLHYDSGEINYKVSEAKRDDRFNISFFVAVYTPDGRFSDFSKKRGLWKFFLKKNNYELIEANFIKKIESADRPEYEVLYPYFLSWMTGYEISFTRSDLYNIMDSREISRPFSLLLAGQLGQLELLFE